MYSPMHVDPVSARLVIGKKYISQLLIPNRSGIVRIKKEKKMVRPLAAFPDMKFTEPDCYKLS